jgi:hypothetical protein
LTEPWTLFRFRQINDSLWYELLQSSIFHSAPEDFNDPFDCRVDTEKALIRALSADLSQERRTALEDIQRKFRAKRPSEFDLGVCCFTNNAEDPLMWAHYADMHRGVCLTYKFPPTYFSDRYPPSDTAPYFVGCEAVSYGDDAYTDWLINGDLQVEHDEPIERAASRTLVSKADCWRHEEEFRTVTSRSKWAMHFEPHFLKQVIFGLRTSDNDKRKVGAIALRNNPDVAFMQATVSDKRDFRLEFPEVRFATRDTVGG